MEIAGVALVKHGDNSVCIQFQYFVIANGVDTIFGHF